jgi:PmbA protein
MRSESDSFDILHRALAAAGADEADAVLFSTDRNISRFAGSSVHQNMSEISASLTLRVITDGCMGVASTSSFDQEELVRTAELARESARRSDPLPKFSGLYRGHDPAPALPTFDEATAALSPADKARALRTMFDRGQAHGVHFAGAYSTALESVAIANSHGMHRYATVTSADATAIAVGAKASGYATRCDRSAAAIDVPTLGDEATLKATLCADSVEELEPGTFDVILEPPALAEVLEWLNMIAFSGQSYEDGSSFFVDNLGKQLLSESLTLADDALDERFLPFPFDMEGMPHRRVPLVERGILRTPVVDKIYADRLGIPPTASCSGLGAGEHGTALHLAMDGGTATREELISSTKLGIWVTRFNYVNGLLEPKTALMTGTTRDGTFLIRDGQVVSRLPNLRWTQSMIEAFCAIDGMTAERRKVGAWWNPLGGTLTPTVKIKDWHITGVQKTK